MSDIKKCVNCRYYNGIKGDGIQFCDELEINRNENDSACNRYEYIDKSELEKEIFGE